MLKSAHKHLAFGLLFSLFIVLTLFLFTPLYGLLSGEQEPSVRTIELTAPASPAQGILAFIAQTDAQPDEDGCYFIIEKSGADKIALRANSEPLSSGFFAVQADWDSGAYGNGIYSVKARCSFSGLASASQEEYFSLSNGAEETGADPGAYQQAISLDSLPAIVCGNQALKAKTKHPAEEVVFEFTGKNSFRRTGEYMGENEYSYEWDTSQNENGIYTIQAVADGLAFSGTSTVKIENLGVMLPSLYSPASGKVTLRAVTSLPADVTFYLVGIRTGRITAESADRLSHFALWNTALFPDGEYTVKAVAAEKDLSGESVPAKIRVANAGVSDKTSARSAAGTSTAALAAEPDITAAFIDFPRELDTDRKLYIAFSSAPDSVEFSVTNPYGEEKFFDNIVQDSATLYWVYWNPSLLPSGNYVFNSYAAKSGKSAHDFTPINVKNILDSQGN